MHGTVMMFLFAVPVVEALAVYLLPNMLGARDLPFPRLSAYAYWAYAIGGLAFFCTLFVGLAPDGGWFMYPPLTSRVHSPGLNADFWLLGIGFIEISRDRRRDRADRRHPDDPRARHVAGAHAGLRVGDAGRRRDDRVRLPGDHRRHRAARAGARLRLAVLHRRARRRPAAVAAPVLVLRPSRGLHHLPAGGGHGVDDAADAGRHAARRPARDRRGADRRPASSASRCGRTTCSPPGLGTPVAELRLGGQPGGRDARPACRCSPGSRRSGAAGVRFEHADAVPARLPAHLRDRRPDRRDGRGAAVRLAGARQLLRRRPPALRADRRHGVAAVRGALLLARRWSTATGSSERLGRWVVRRSSFGGFHLDLLPDARAPGCSACRGASYTYDAGLGWEWPNLLSSIGAAVLGAGVALLGSTPSRTLRRPRQRARRPVARADARVAARATTTGTRSIPAGRQSRDPLWQQPGARRRGRAGPRTGCRARRPAGARRSSPRRARPRCAT